MPFDALCTLSIVIFIVWCRALLVVDDFWSSRWLAQVNQSSDSIVSQSSFTMLQFILYTLNMTDTWILCTLYSVWGCVFLFCLVSPQKDHMCPNNVIMSAFLTSFNLSRLIRDSDCNRVHNTRDRYSLLVSIYGVMMLYCILVWLCI